MKKLHVLPAFLLLQISVFAQNIVFADANFKAKLLESSPANYIASNVDGDYIAIDSNSDNEIQYSEALAVNWLSVISTAITDLSGIENFTNLHGLSLGTPNITDLPISALTQLTGISLDLNSTISLTALENLYSLEHIQLSGLGFTTINLQNLHGLKFFDSFNTALTDINFCGTIVYFARFESNSLLESVNFKNNVISTVYGRPISNGPPPLPNIRFEICPAINHICHDEGEYDAVSATLYDQLDNITFTTTCDSDCLLSTNQFDAATAMMLYPNPAESSITIEDKNENIASITIYNTIGQLVKTNTNPTISKQMKIDVSTLKIGAYFISIQTDSGKTTQRFIKI